MKREVAFFGRGLRVDMDTSGSAKSPKPYIERYGKKSSVQSKKVLN